jgi:thiol-disulfide isomerase/thioredoxin
MSLQVSTETPPAIAEFLEAHEKPSYLVVYASPRPSDGLSWCGDCRRAEPLITKKLSARADHVKIVHAGSEAEYVPATLYEMKSDEREQLTAMRRWRSPSNPWRQSPFLIAKLPTIIKVTESGDEGVCCVDGQCGIDEEADGTVWNRLVEEECFDENKLDAFLGK